MPLLFMFDWSIYRLFVLNRSWKPDSLQMMIFVNVCSTWSMVQLKTRFETSITRNVVNCVRLFNFCYLITHVLPVLTTVSIYPNLVFYVWLVDLRPFVINTAWKLDSLQMMIFVYVCSNEACFNWKRVLSRQ
jgi:hypothetical protein